MILNRNIVTASLRPLYSGKKLVLRDIILNEKDVPEEFFIAKSELQKWKYLKGAKKEERQSSSGHVYHYSEGSMSFPDSTAKPARTIVTGEGGVSASRFKHIILTSSGRYRRLTPLELERINMFPDEHTKLEGVSDSRRAFIMGNALVVGVVQKIGQSLAQQELAKQKQTPRLHINRGSVEITLKPLGVVKLRLIDGLKDIDAITKLLSQKTSDEIFTLKTLSLFVTKSSINLDYLKTLPERQLMQLAEAFIKKEPLVFQYFKDTNDIFADFKQAFQKYHSTIFDLGITNILPLEQLRHDLDSRILWGDIEKATRLASSIHPQLAAMHQQIAPQILGFTQAHQTAFLNAAAGLTSATIGISQAFSDSIQEFAEQWASVSSNIQKQINQSLQHYNNIRPDALKILRQYNWIISPNLPMDLVFEVADLNQKEKGRYKAINKLFVDFFSRNNWENLEALTKLWENNLHFQQRMPIIRDCIRVLKSADNQTNAVNVILPTLIAQIDGCWTDYLVSKKIIKKPGGQYVTFSNKKKEFKKQANISNDFDVLAREILLDVLFQKDIQSKSGKQKPRKVLGFNRNGIMHGELKKYGRRTYLIKSFLLMDFLVSLK